MFDFKDGDGSVPARLHKNPDGTEGGWIADTAHVSKAAHIGPDAQVYGQAKVSGHARVLGQAQIYDGANIYDSVLVRDQAHVYGETHVYDQALIYGEARVYDEARIYGGALVYGAAHVCNQARIFGSSRICGTTKVEAGWVHFGHYRDVLITEDPKLIYISRHVMATVVGSQVIIKEEPKTLLEWDCKPPDGWEQLRPLLEILIPKAALTPSTHYLDQLLDDGS